MHFLPKTQLGAMTLFQGVENDSASLVLDWKL
jgi:hypothetical protein